jgi:hypothetical protein
MHAERGHGRINRWTTWAIDVGLGLPHAARLAVIRRDVADLAGQPLGKEIALVVTSRARLTAAEISHHTRQHWGIENLEYRPRDTVWHEDNQQAYLGNGPLVMETFPKPGARPARHHQDHRDRPSNRPPRPASHCADHIASHPVVSHRL